MMNKRIVAWIHSLPVTADYIIGAAAIKNITDSESKDFCISTPCKSAERLICTTCIFHSSMMRDLTPAEIGLLFDYKVHDILNVYLSRVSIPDLMEYLL